jgi:hypothetical protein
MLARVNMELVTKKVGILIHANPNLFTNGITQNAYFIYQCFTNMGITCEFVCQESKSNPFSLINLPITFMSKENKEFNPKEFSVVISVSRRFTEENILYLRSHKVRMVSFICGNHYPEDQHAFIFGKASSTTISHKDTGDELWIIPSFIYSKGYFEILSGKPVYIMPHLWSASLVKERLTLEYKKTEDHAIYNKPQHNTKKINILITEPNLATVKTAWLPVVACEWLHTKYPDLIDTIYVFNFPENDLAYHMISKLSINSKVRKFKRLPLPEILLHFNSLDSMPIFVTHHYLTSLNYLYYEALQYGYPLVHNSADLDGCGYFYPGDDPKACADAIYAAFTKHNESYDAYCTMAKEYLYRNDPLNPLVGKECKRLMTNLLVRGM